VFGCGTGSQKRKSLLPLRPPTALMGPRPTAFSCQFQVPPLESPEALACGDVFRTSRCVWLRPTADIETEWPHSKMGTLCGLERFSEHVP